MDVNIETILKSCLKCEDERFIIKLQELLDSNDSSKRPFLEEMDAQAIKFVVDSFSVNKCSCSEDYFINRFLYFKNRLIEIESIDNYDDFCITIDSYIKNRVNITNASIISSVAGSVSQGDYNAMDKLWALELPGKEERYLIETPEDYMKLYNERISKKERGISTGISYLDEETTGMQKGSLTTIGAFTGGFKTTFANNIMYNNYMFLKRNICYISLEVDKQIMMGCQFSLHSYKSPKFNDNPIGYRVFNTSIDDTYSKEINAIVNDYFAPSKDKGKMEILDQTDFETFSFAEIKQRLYEFDDKCLAAGLGHIDMIIVDHINLCKFVRKENSRDNEYQVGNMYVSFFRKLAVNFRNDRETGSPVPVSILVLAQLNREGFKKAESKIKRSDDGNDNKLGKYDLSALAEFNELERGSSVVFALYTNDFLKEEKCVKIQILKNRFGRTLIDSGVDAFIDPDYYYFGSRDIGDIPKLVKGGNSTPKEKIDIRAESEDIENVEDFMSDFDAWED